MLQAIKSVDNGQGLHKAVRAYNVPVETLSRGVGTGPAAAGPKFALTE